jgi:hypothetical protein
MMMMPTTIIFEGFSMTAKSVISMFALLLEIMFTRMRQYVPRQQLRGESNRENNTV